MSKNIEDKSVAVTAKSKKSVKSSKSTISKTDLVDKMKKMTRIKKGDYNVHILIEEVKNLMSKDEE